MVDAASAMRPAFGMALAIALITALAAGPAYAKKAKKKSKSELEAEASAAAVLAKKKKVASSLSGPLPPLPSSSGLTADVSGLDSGEALFAAAATAAPRAATASVTGPTQRVITWRIADWRKQMSADVRALRWYKERLARRLEEAQRQNFPVAVRYLKGVYDSGSEFARLAQQSLGEFNDAFPSDRNEEKSPTPPEGARRIRLYLDKVIGLDRASIAFLERTTQERKEQVVRINP